VTPDVVIVGGGAAGITAALYLARFRRSVVLLDANRSRLATIPWSHNYPGFAEGVSGASLYENLKSQLRAYPVQWYTAEVDSVETTGDGFAVRCASGRTVAGRMLLATGVKDIAPEAPHMLEALREGACGTAPCATATRSSGAPSASMAAAPAPSPKPCSCGTSPHV
jgi:thioredoxin reductase (NADPH)